MKSHTLLLLILAFVSAACTKNKLSETLTVPSEQYWGNNTSKSYYSESDYSVSIEDVERYIAFKKSFSEDKLNREGETIMPLVSKTGLIVSYLINYESGWEILSADKRIQTVLAWAGEGTLQINDLPPATQLWLSDIINYVFDFIEKNAFRHDKDLSLDQKERLDFWSIITSRSIPAPNWSPDQQGYPSGHWELTGSDQQIIEEGVGHLVPVHWGNNQPYNSYCPLVKYEYGNLRSPAGCVAVAGAQLLYYLHGILGVPEATPTTGYVSGYALPAGAFTQVFGDESSTAWSQMVNNNDYVALLMGKTGKEVGIHYASFVQENNGLVTNVESGGDVWNLAYYLLNDLGISWTWAALAYETDVDAIIASINNSSPVLVGAAQSADNVGHCFLIDAWKRTKYQYNYHYEWVYDDPVNSGLWLVPCETVSTYSSPISSYFGMNWGWDGACDNMWFSPLGSWSPSGTAFDGYRQTFRNFNLAS